MSGINFTHLLLLRSVTVPQFTVGEAHRDRGSSNQTLASLFLCCPVWFYLKKKKKVQVSVENCHIQRVQIQVFTGRSGNVYYLAENTFLNC